MSASQPKPISRDQARRVISKLDAETFGAVLHNERYWFGFVYTAVLARCDDLIAQSPKDAYPLAQQLPLFASRIRGLSSGQVAQSFAVLGSCLRALTRHAEAHAAYRKALSLADSPRSEALVKRRLSVLFFAEGRVQRAIETLDGATPHLQASDSEKATNLVLRGVIVSTQDPHLSIQHYSRALDLAHPLRDRNTYVTAARNLAGKLATFGSVLDCRRAAKYLRKASTTLTRGCNGPAYRRCALQRGLILWSQALIDWRFGSHRQALRNLQSAHEALLDQEALDDALLALLDIVLLRLELGETLEARELLQRGHLIAQSRRLAQEQLAFEMLLTAIPGSEEETD